MDDKRLNTNGDLGDTLSGPAYGRNAEPTKERFRVAIVTASLGPGGAEKQAFYMARALAEAGVEVRVYNLSRGGEYEDALRRLHVEVKWIGWLPAPPFRILRFVTALRNFRPHIIQSVHAYTNVYTAIAGRVLSAVSVGGLRSDLSACLEDSGRFARCLLTWPDAIAVNSRRALEQVKQEAVLDPKRSYFLPNAIDLSRFPERAGTDDAQSDADCNCVCVGRLFPAKRVDMFLRALAAARSTEPGIRGTVVGYGPEAVRLQHLAAELQLPPRALSFLGLREDVADILQQAAIFVFCSESEGTPNVILEAMAASLPVITTPAGDAAEVVQRAGAGYVVPFGDVEALADAMMRLARSPALRQRLGRAGRDYVVQHCTASDLAARLFKIYADVARTSLRWRSHDRLARFQGCSERIDV